MTNNPHWDALAVLAQQVPCPQCQAGRGTSCKTQAAPAHPARIRKATKENPNA